MLRSAHYRRTLASEPGSILCSLVDVFDLEPWLLAHDILGGIPVAKKLEHEVDRDAHASYGRPPLTYARIDLNAV